MRNRSLQKWCILAAVLILPVFGVSNLHAALQEEVCRENAVVKAVKAVSPAVVNLSSEYEIRERANPFFRSPLDPFFRDFFEGGMERTRKLTSLGSGVIIDGKQGLILTNAHVIHQTSTITVTLNDAREFEAEIVGADAESDLAVLKIATDDPLPAIHMGDSQDIMIGETVIAIGNPFGFSNTVTTGVVSAVNRSIRADERVYRNFIQTDASINPGNSGGPLLNISGDLIGINTAIYAEAQGIGFAIPINTAKKIINDLIAFGEVVYGWLGLTVQDMDSRLAAYLGLQVDQGVVVTGVEETGPAYTAGLREGDVLIEANGDAISAIDAYEGMLRSLTEGDTVDLKIIRGGEKMEFRVTAAVFPDQLALELAYRLLGVRVANLSPQQKARIRADGGVVISEIDPASRLYRFGAAPGDVIRKINEIRISNVEDFKKAIVKYRWKDSIVAILQRGSQQYYITLPL